MQTTRITLTLCLILSYFAAFGQNRPAVSDKTAQIEGIVLEEGTGAVPVEYATVWLFPSQEFTTTDKAGKFRFSNLAPGKVSINIQFVGMETIDTTLTLTAGQVHRMEFRMKFADFRLEKVIVTAVQNKAGQATASKISRQAMDHLQTSSLADVMQLLPGAEVNNPNLSGPNLLNIRTATSGPTDNNSMGTAIFIDGAPISNNANFQALAPTIVAGASAINGSSPDAGIDTRSISTDNIESIEVIRGIASAAYGDLTSGTVIIKSKAGKAPLSIRFKTNPQMYQASASKGFSIGEKGDHLNLSTDYAYNVTRATEAYDYYQRFNLKGLWSKQVSKWNGNTSLEMHYGNDTRELNPDDLRSQHSSGAEDIGFRFNHGGVWSIGKGWLKSLNYNLAFKYTRRHSFSSELLSNAFAPHSTAMENGTVVSNFGGKHVYDINGDEITNFRGKDAEAWATYLPYEYYGHYDIYGKELNGFAKIALNFNKSWDKINNHILVGIDYRMDGNTGRGKVYDDRTPPYRVLSADNASYRPRPYYDIPFIHQTGLYVQDDYTQDIGERQLIVSPGARFDFVNGKTALSPRINLSFDILPKHLTLRGGYGIFAKAPSVLYLYPEKAYFDYINFNNTTSAPHAGEQLLISTTRVFDATNKDLEIARNRKAEVGIDLKFAKRFRLSLTAYDELMKNGYSLGTTLDTWKLVPYTTYKAASSPSFSQPVLELDKTYNIFSHYATPGNDYYEHNQGVEFEMDLGRFQAIRTSFYLNGAYMKTVYKDQGYVFGTNDNANEMEKNIAVYEQGLYTYHRNRFNTAVRITHNIPEIGFVITLTAQINWLYKYWTEYGNDEIFESYISRIDGKVYDFDPALKDDPEFAYMFSSVSDTRFLKELYPPLVTFNLNLSKEIGDVLTASFYVNNMFNSRPLYESVKSPGSFTELGNKIFFGFDLKVNIK